MKQTVDKQKAQPMPHCHAVLTCLAPRGAYVQKDLAFCTREREGEYIGCVMLFAILTVYCARQVISADYERQFISLAKNELGDCCKRDSR